MRLFALLLFSLFTASPVLAASADHAPAIALHGMPKYGASFQHLDYVNPDAPKGGELRLAAIGSFDSLTPYILKGQAADGISMVFETLMERSLDEPFSQYGLLAESVTVAPDKSWVAYELRPAAHFSNGTKVTPDDVIWSFETLKTKGHPFYRSYYAFVSKAEKWGKNGVKFQFSTTTNPELPMIMGELPVLSKQDWAGRAFDETTLRPPVGSGPYRVGKIDPGRAITYDRDPNWWGRDLPINRGRFNFDHIAYDYYRDPGIAIQALLAGRYDLRAENIAKEWATAYTGPQLDSRLLQKLELKNGNPAGMQGFVFNTRRPVFADRRVRQALQYAFDFEWSNKTIAFGAYSRTHSYFENGEMASSGLPDAAEKALLAPLKDIPPEVLTTPFTVPTTDGSGNNRDGLRKAASLLKEAGWDLKDGALRNSATGQAFTFDIVDANPAFERWIQPFLRNLERLGIKARFRLVDPAQYQRLMDEFDFDMAVGLFPQSLSPGNEQRDYWTSAAADVKGSRNLAGIKSPAVDALVEKLIAADSRDDLVTAARALDRVLLSGYYVIPHWHTPVHRLAFWDKFGRPSLTPPYGLPVAETWWVDSAKDAKVQAGRQGR
jgi:microcin C transport system substrate-binding protein